MRPKVGQSVLYWARDSNQPYAATVSFVWSDDRVNIGYLDTAGVHHNATNILFIDRNSKLVNHPYCEPNVFEEKRKPGRPKVVNMNKMA